MYTLMDGMMRSGNGFDRAGEFGDHMGPLEIVGMVLCIILWAVLVTALVLLIITLVRRLKRSGADQEVLASQSTDTQVGESIKDSEALRILQERFARGEIGHEEYLERKGDLTSS